MREPADRHVFKVPVIGGIFQYSSIIFFSRTLSMLIGSGVPIVEGLRATRDSISNRAVKKVIEGMEERVLSGESLSGPLLNEVKIFPPWWATWSRWGKKPEG